MTSACGRSWKYTESHSTELIDLWSSPLRFLNCFFFIIPMMPWVSFVSILYPWYLECPSFPYCTHDALGAILYHKGWYGDKKAVPVSPILSSTDTPMKIMMAVFIHGRLFFDVHMKDDLVKLASLLQGDWGQAPVCLCLCVVTFSIETQKDGRRFWGSCFDGM